MKLPSLLLISSAAFYLSGCAGDEPTSQPAAKTGGHHHQEAQEESGDEPIDKKPRLGMSTRQIKSMYGEADDIRHSSRGEVWDYWFNKGGMFIPYNFGYKPRHGTFTFNASGTLIDFDYNE